MEARNRSLPDWLTKIRTRQIVLPRFQRFEAWSNNQIKDLLSTVLKELPAGAVLVLEVGDKEPFYSRPISNAPEQGEKITEHLLDGQQRLTALWRSLHNKYENTQYFIEIGDDIDSDFPYSTTCVTKSTRNNKIYPVWTSIPTETWERKLIPVNLLRPDTDAEKESKEWAKSATSGDLDKTLELMSIIDSLRNKFAKFNIPFLSLPVTTKPEVALDVFIKMNTSSSPLSHFDIVVAQIEESSARSLHEFIEELRRDVPNITHYNTPEDTLLAVTALLQNKTPSQGTYLSPEFPKDFISNWKNTKHGIKKAVAFLSDEKIFDSKRLPSEVVFYVIAALWANTVDGLDKEGEIRLIARKYMWRSFFTERYDSTTNTRAFQDYKDLIKLINNEAALPEIFNENNYPITSLDDISNASWPSKKDRLARAILAISLKSGGLDFADGALASYEDIQTREYHHIFPKAWLETKGYKDHEINKALNCALISWKTNRNIYNKPPSEYISERMEKSSLGEVEINRRLNSHTIPVHELTKDNYDEFIIKRADLILNIAKKLCNGELVEGSL